MIVLFTDFGLPYTGQMRSVLHDAAPGVPVVDLFTDLAPQNVQAAAYLLPAYARDFAAGSVFLCVVDPGVGSARAACVVEAGGRWFVGPDNGLFALLFRRAATARQWEILWRPLSASATFHGRDLFAPVAARIAQGEMPGESGDWLSPRPPTAGAAADWPDDLAQVVYIDGFGNAVTGLRSECLPAQATILCGGQALKRMRTFSDVAPGQAFWYENANGLVEIAANRRRAADELNLTVGSPAEPHSNTQEDVTR